MTAAAGASNASAGTSATWWNGESPTAQPGSAASDPSVSHRKLRPTSPKASAALARGTSA